MLDIRYSIYYYLLDIKLSSDVRASKGPSVAAQGTLFSFSPLYSNMQMEIIETKTALASALNASVQYFQRVFQPKCSSGTKD